MEDMGGEITGWIVGVSRGSVEWREAVHCGGFGAELWGRMVGDTLRECGGFWKWGNHDEAWNDGSVSCVAAGMART